MTKTEKDFTVSAIMDLRQQFLSEIDAFMATRAMTQTQFGVKAVGDSSFVPRLREGASPRIDTVEKVRAFMASYKLSRAG